MLQVGIHNNVEVTKVEKNTTGSLEITFKQVNAASKLGAFGGGSISAGDGETATIRFFALKNTDWQGVNLTFEGVQKAYTAVKDVLVHILQQFMTTDKIDAIFTSTAIFKGTGITDTNVEKEIVKQDVLTKVNDNLVDVFMKAIAPFVGKGDKFRVKFIRSSAKSNFPKLPSSFLNTQPFMEPMSVPAEASKIKYTDYELGWRGAGESKAKTGVDLSDSSQFKGEADTEGGSPEKAAQITNLFGMKS